MAAMATRFLLVCGLLAPVVFVGTDILAGASWRGYDPAWRSINELSAVGSPTRQWAAPLFAVVNVLTIALGAGIWRVADGAPVRVVAGMVVANGVFALASAFFPNQAGVTPRLLSPGVLLAAASVICMVLAFVAGALAFDGWVRAYSVLVLLSYALLTIVAYAAQMQPRVGFQERVMAYTWMAWLALVAATLLTERQHELTAA